MSQTATAPKSSPFSKFRILVLIILVLVIGISATLILLQRPRNTLYDAQSAYLSGDYPAAIGYFSIILGNNPDDIEALVGRGLAYLQIGEFELARTDFLHVTELEPDDERAYIQLGLISIARQLPYSTIDYFDSAIAIDPDDAELYYNRGRGYGMAELYLQAIVDFEQAIELNGTKPEYYLALGNVYYILNNTAEALDAYERYTQLEENDDLNVLARMQELRGR